MRLICNFWDQASFACRAQGRYGRPFKAGRGVTQGGPLSPKIFNVMVDAIVREWLRRLYYVMLHVTRQPIQDGYLVSSHAYVVDDINSKDLNFHASPFKDHDDDRTVAFKSLLVFKLSIYFNYYVAILPKGHCITMNSSCSIL